MEIRTSTDRASDLVTAGGSERDATTFASKLQSWWVNKSHFGEGKVYGFSLPPLAGLVRKKEEEQGGGVRGGDSIDLI